MNTSGKAQETYSPPVPKATQWLNSPLFTNGLLTQSKAHASEMQFLTQLASSGIDMLMLSSEDICKALGVPFAPGSRSDRLRPDIADTAGQRLGRWLIAWSAAVNTLKKGSGNAGATSPTSAQQGKRRKLKVKSKFKTKRNPAVKSKTDTEQISEPQAPKAPSPVWLPQSSDPQTPQSTEPSSPDTARSEERKEDVGGHVGSASIRTTDASSPTESDSCPNYFVNADHLLYQPSMKSVPLALGTLSAVLWHTWTTQVGARHSL